MENQNFVPCCTPITKESYNKMLPFLNIEYEITDFKTNNFLSNTDMKGDFYILGSDRHDGNKKVSNFQFLINSGVELTLQDVYIEVNDENRKEVIEFIIDNSLGVLPHHMIHTSNGLCMFEKGSYYLDVNNVPDTSKLIQATIQEVKEYFPPPAAPIENLTLKNIQVDCTNLTTEQIENMKRVVVENGYELWDHEISFKKTARKCMFMKNAIGNEFLIAGHSDKNNKTTITYEKFMELFDKKKHLQMWGRGNRRILDLDGKMKGCILQPNQNNNFQTITDSIASLLEYKNEKYGNPALEPLNIFSNKCKTGQRLDDKLARIKNSDKLKKNDVVDLIGYLILTCKENNWTNFDEFKD